MEFSQGESVQKPTETFAFAKIHDASYANSGTSYPKQLEFPHLRARNRSLVHLLEEKLLAATRIETLLLPLLQEEVLWQAILQRPSDGIGQLGVAGERSLLRKREKTKKCVQNE